MTAIDWIIIIVFLATMVALGLYFSRSNKDIKDYFLGGRNMPSGIVTLAIVGASISAGTFVGAPQLAFNGNMTYLMLSVGAIIGGLLVSVLFLPTLYKADTITIYGYLRQRFGLGTSIMSSAVFLFGQLLTAGSRLFIAAIAVSVMLYNDIKMDSLIYSILILGTITTLYTLVGGIKGLIFIDAIQIIIVLIAGIVCICFLWNAIPGGFSQIWEGLTKSPEGNKLKLIDTGVNFSEPYNLVGALVACTIFKFAQFGTDHEFIQRSLTCKSVKHANRSMIFSQLVSLPIVLLFMVIGSLLYIFYSRPDIMGSAYTHETLADSRQVFPQYIFSHFPPGLLGFTMVGLLSAALGSFNSAINAMSSSFMTDIILPLKARRGNIVPESAGDELKTSKFNILFMGGILTCFSVITAFMQSAGSQNLADFALGIMCFAYSGLLGIFLCAILTKRGNFTSALGALVAGVVVVFAMQTFITPFWTPLIFGKLVNIAWPWWVVIGGAASFLICVCGNPPVKSKR